MKTICILLTAALASCAAPVQRAAAITARAEARAIQKPSFVNQFNTELLGYIQGTPPRRSAYNPYLSPVQNRYLSY